MKSFTVSEAQANLPGLIQMVEMGEEIELTHQDRLLAKLVPPNEDAPRVDWSETWDKVDAVFGGKPAPGLPGSQLVIAGRR